MQPLTPTSPEFDGSDDLSPFEAAAIVGRALMLQRAQGTGHVQPVLRGKYLGLVCERDDVDGALLFRRAATELGARVAHVRPSLGSESSAEEIRHTARILGRLYDAVECQGMAPPLVKHIRSSAGVPVFDGMAIDSHPTARLAALLGEETPLADRRRWVVQAVLLGVIG